MLFSPKSSLADHIVMQTFFTMRSLLHSLCTCDTILLLYLTTTGTLLSRTSAHGRSQLKRQNLGVGGYTDKVLKWFNYPRARAHPGCKVSSHGAESTCIVGSSVLCRGQPALPFNNQFIIKLVKMWPGGTPHVVVGTLKISLDRLKKQKLHPKWKEKKSNYSNVEKNHKSACVSLMLCPFFFQA